MFLPKVLVSCPVNYRKEYTAEAYLKNITGLTYPNKHFYFVDNSVFPLYHVYRFIDAGFNCDYIAPEQKNQNQYICESQNKIREYFLAGDYDYLCFIEEDLFPEPDIIQQLLNYKEAVVSARYFIGEGEKSHLLHLVHDDTFGENVNINYPPSGSYAEFGTGKNSSTVFGFGCCLIHRDVLEEIPFRIIDDTTHSDVPFALDLKFLGIEVEYHEKIIEHFNQAGVHK